MAAEGRHTNGLVDLLMQLSESANVMEIDDIRRSIDVLDQVLSEFDDIEPFYGDDECNPEDHEGKNSPSGDQEVPDEPPPIDRSLKPKSNPPTLPEKIRKKSHEAPERIGPGNPSQKSPLESAPSFPNTHRSLESRRSGVSSHDYQEINSDVCSNPGRRKSACSDRERLFVSNPPQRQRRRSTKEYSPRTEGGHVPRMVPEKGFENPLRKSRSGDVSLTAEDVQLGRGRRSSRRHSHQRRGKSSDRFLDHHHHHHQPFLDPRRLPESGVIDPRLVDPLFIDQRGLDPRHYDLRQIDPRFLSSKVPNQGFDPRFIDPKLVDPNLCDPRFYDPSFLDPPVFVDDPLLMPFDGPRGRRPVDDSVQFPHLMGRHAAVPGPLSMPPSAMDFHPHTIPPYEYPPMQDPMMGPDHLVTDYPFPTVDPHFEGLPAPPPVNGFDLCIQNADPLLPPLPLIPPMRSPHGYPMDGPRELPFSCPPDFLPVNFSPRERLSFDGGGGRSFPYSRDPRLVGERGWLPPTPEEARKAIQRLVRNQNHPNCEEEPRDGRERFVNVQRVAKYPRGPGDHFRRHKSAGSSDSSGRSSSLEDIRCRHGDHWNRGYKGHHPPSDSKRNSGSKPGAFRVGEAVRRDEQSLGGEFQEKETGAPVPRFASSGGKDSGFDESPIIDENSSLKTAGSGGASPQNGVGGGFVVAGVFSDSSKMYIPAPPSPTPDYDHEQGVSDGEDSDIPPEPFYVSSKAKKTTTSDNNEKTSSSSNRDSLSEDSLQGGTPAEKKQGGSPPSKDGNSLQAMMEEFHMGLPPPPIGREEGRFSDDSLEEEEEESSSVFSPSSRPSTNDDLHPRRPDSMESLISMDGSTTSFDYMSDLHQHKNLEKTRRNSSEAPPPVKGSDRHGKANDISDSRGPNSGQKSSPKIKKRSQSSPEGEDNVKGGRNSRVSLSPSEKNDNFTESSSSRDLSRESRGSSSELGEKGVPKFDTIKHLIKEGLIEGLDETPPDFAPPPPPKMIRSASMIEERADSGIGSTASTNNRADESGSSDSPSDRLSSTPPEKIFENRASREVLQRRTSSPPPLPPPRDSSMNARPSIGSDLPSTQPPLVRNQSWLYKNKKPNRAPNPNANYVHKSSVDAKMGQFEDRNRNVKKERTGPNNNLASQYVLPQDLQESQLDNHTFHENMKNLHPNKKLSESYSLISEDQASVSSHGSRSGRFFSRFTESMKSGSRNNSPFTAKHGAKDSKSKKAPPKYHADFIRVPSRIKSEAPQPPLGCKPPEFKNISDPSSVLPLSRDGSGRFRSIEDLADVTGKSLELRRAEDDQKKKGKKNSTLPPNLTPADMFEQEKELKRTNCTSSGNKSRDESDGSKFKFNIFKGLWRRNKYSFDKV